MVPPPPPGLGTPGLPRGKRKCLKRFVCVSHVFLKTNCKNGPNIPTPSPSPVSVKVPFQGNKI